jgi:hypothetical protein
MISFPIALSSLEAVSSITKNYFRCEMGQRVEEPDCLSHPNPPFSMMMTSSLGGKGNLPAPPKKRASVILYPPFSRIGDTSF